MHGDGNSVGKLRTSNDLVRLEILKLLIIGPLKRTSIHQRARNSNYMQIEDELYLLMTEGVLTARDRRFFVRNEPYVRKFIHVDRRFGT
jgi:hypothetical protein